MKFEVLPDKVQARNLTSVDHIMVGDMLWRVVHTTRSMAAPNNMLQLAYYTHETPQSYKFHPARDEERFVVFRKID